MSQNKRKPQIQHLQKLINECYEAMVEAINDECNANGSEDARSAACTVNTNDGYIDLWMDHRGKTEVIIVHDNDNEGECPLLCKAIEDGMPDWSETVEHWEEDNPYEATASAMKQTTFTGDTDRFFSHRLDLRLIVSPPS